MKLNLGAGPNVLPGYINVDRSYEPGLAASDRFPSQVWGDVYPLPHDDNSVDEIRASHILEHFSHTQTADVLGDWIRVLKHGGVLKVAVPDFGKIAATYVADPQAPFNVQGYVMGGHFDENDKHGAIFERDGLTAALELLGLIDIEDWHSEIDDCASLDISLNLMGRKSGGSDIKRVPVTVPPTPRLAWGPVGIAGVADDEPASESVVLKCFCSAHAIIDDACYAARIVMPGQDQIEASATFASANVALQYAEATVRQIDRGVRAANHPDPRFMDVEIKPGDVVPILATPRLGFTSFMHCALIACSRHNLDAEIYGGAFWEQGISRAALPHLDDGTKYILTLDYDSVFTAEDIRVLYGIMEARPDIDALIPLQSKRESEYPLFRIDGSNGETEHQIDIRDLQTDVLRIASGHFGLTMLRVEALRKLPKPWMHGQPDENGDWSDRKVDPDIYFWRNWADAGLTAYLANRVVIGHQQLMVTWPDKRLHSTHQYIGDYHSAGKPPEAWR